MRRSANLGPSPIKLAMLAVRLATSREKVCPQNKVTRNLGVNWKHQISEAYKLWRACKYLLERTPKPERRGLSVDECALVAAELVHGQPTHGINLSSVASSALELWQRCKQRLADNRELDGILQAAYETLEKKELKDPAAVKFPISVKAATQRWLPKSRWPNRARWFRRYLRDSFRVVLPTEVEIGNGNFNPMVRSPEECERLGDIEFQRLMEERVNGREYGHYKSEFPLWLEDHRARTRREKASKGGKGKAFKAKLKPAQARQVH